MPYKVTAQYAASVALSFYDSKLRNNRGLRRSCADRRVLNDVIDQWKAEEKLDGRPITGVPRSTIISSLKFEGLIERKSNISTRIAWTDDPARHIASDNADGRKSHADVRKSHVDNVALSFYNAKLRGDASLRRKCADRHVLDATIDKWKAEERLDGRPINGVSRSDIIRSLLLRWDLIFRHSAAAAAKKENIIIWREDMVADGDDADEALAQKAVPRAISIDEKTDRISKTVARIKNSRLELESDRNGVFIDKIEFGSRDGVCRIGYSATQQVKIRNDSDIDVYCTVKSEVATQRGIRVEGDSEFELPAGSSDLIKVSYLPKVLGITKSIIVFNFDPIDFDEDDSIEAFSIIRYISIRAGDPDDFAILKPIAPFVKKKRGRDDRDKFSNPVRVRSAGAIAPFANPLGRYAIPKDVERLSYNENEAMQALDGMFRGEGSHFDKEEAVDYSASLTVDNYAGCMQHLLWLEEAQMRVDITSYDLSDVPLLREGRSFKLFVPGLAESRPSVLKGDKILFRAGEGNKFEGLVHRTTQEYAYVDLPRSFAQSFVDGQRVDVRFTFSRTTLRTSHQALAAMDNKGYDSPHNKIIFPQLLDVQDNPPLNALNAQIARPAQLNFYNRTLNREQQTAVVGVIRSVARPAPYLIYGPPGTGKTVTVVESILQTKKAAGADPGARMLVCAPSNTAVDLVVERLAPFVTKREMLRLVAYSRDRASVPARIMEYTNYDEASDSFVMPGSAAIKSYKIVAVTVASGGKLPNNDVLDHFTHVFIDEAGHSVEAEALACLALVTTQKSDNPPAVTLAGDPKQLGPIIRSDVCKHFGLDKSFLERLSEMEPYARSEEADDLGNHYDKRMITRLVRNYRSHPQILKLPNELFYDGDLVADADVTRSHRFVDWEHLPKRGFPVIFHGIEGEDTREANSPSWFNPDEAQIVKMYVDLLVKDTKRNRCKPEDIGIIAPYHRQVQKIRMLLNAHGYSESKVGSVEEFQGSERPVIIISTVRSTVDYISFDQKHKLGFLSSEKRFNVAITRAQGLLIMVGNPFTLETDPNWKSLINHTIDGGGYTGVDYVAKNQQRDSTSVVEDAICGFHGEEEKKENYGEDFPGVSHVTAQEGPAWRSEE